MLDGNCILEANPSTLRLIADRLRERAREAWERAGRQERQEEQDESKH